jgi:hypothetical protein
MALKLTFSIVSLVTFLHSSRCRTRSSLWKWRGKVRLCESSIKVRRMRSTTIDSSIAACCSVAKVKRRITCGASSFGVVFTRQRCGAVLPLLPYTSAVRGVIDTYQLFCHAVILGRQDGLIRRYFGRILLLGPRFGWGIRRSHWCWSGVWSIRDGGFFRGCRRLAPIIPSGQRQGLTPFPHFSKGLYLVGSTIRNRPKIVTRLG